MVRPNEWTNISGRISAGTQPQLLRFLYAEVNELLRDRLLDEQALH